MAEQISLHAVLRRFARTMAQPYDVTDALCELCDARCNNAKLVDVAAAVVDLGLDLG